ncbi:hypothetical protein [Curtobacterium sp. MCBA15_004]|uniref:hypothetical protein n=1 Tax=Curtobacterium sp. MCBA15_004 TaxID=1898733 RepID=UPI0011149952|nr:hypothetical protein [Curtobacterium sp. MCBA15_004]WIA95816.1 hypothetical protein QOL16_11920 [Curtobacterium sp. MCBA15_004]
MPTIRASRLTRNQALARTQARRMNELDRVIRNVLDQTGGGEFHDTSGFHERDTEWRPTIGFTTAPWLDATPGHARRPAA